MADDWKGYWPILERIETEVCELTFVIAFTDDHRGVYSVRLADLLLRIGAECENIGKSTCVSRSFVPSGKKAEDLKFPGIGDAISSNIAIYAKPLSIVWPYQSFTTNSIKPFDSWKPSGSTNPAWYKAYNDVKHDRATNGKNANVWNVVNGLGGLFLLNLTLREPEIRQHSEPIDLARMRIAGYSDFFSPASFLRVDSPTGMSTSLTGSSMRSLEFDWK